MKIIHPELQSTIAATSEAVNFPAINLLDNKPQKVWEATGSSATLTLSVSAGGANAVGLFHTNAVSATVVVKNSGGVTIQTTVVNPLPYNRLWIDFPTQSNSCSVLITLDAAAGIAVRAGVIRAGVGADFPNPEYGMRETKEDRSIVKELSNGAVYTRKRTILRAFNPSFLMSHAERRAIMNIYDAYGPNPLAVLVVGGVSDHEYCVFGRMDVPDGNYSLPGYGKLNMNIKEAV